MRELPRETCLSVARLDRFVNFGHITPARLAQRGGRAGTRRAESPAEVLGGGPMTENTKDLCDFLHLIHDSYLGWAQLSVPHSSVPST